MPPSLLITHSVVTHASAAEAHALQDQVDAILADHGEQIAETGGLQSIHDFRSLETYHPSARAAWFDRMRARPKNYLLRSVVVVPNRPLVRMAVQAGNLLMALHIGGDLEMTTDIDRVLRDYRVDLAGP